MIKSKKQNSNGANNLVMNNIVSAENMVLNVLSPAFIMTAKHPAFITAFVVVNRYLNPPKNMILAVAGQVFGNQ